MQNILFSIFRDTSTTVSITFVAAKNIEIFRPYNTTNGLRRSKMGSSINFAFVGFCPIDYSFWELTLQLHILLSTGWTFGKSFKKKLNFRNGTVKFVGDDRWYRREGRMGTYYLPGKKTEGYYVEAIDASGTELMFEGALTK